MFAKISTLSLFVFCLFSLGQAAPILDDSDISVSARELDFSLVTRGFIHNLFNKPDPATKKRIEALSVSAECKMYNIHLAAQQAYTTEQNSLTEEKDKLVVKGNKSKDPMTKEYQKRIKDLTKSSKEAGKKVKADTAALKKLGVDATQCGSNSTNSTLHN